jgi:hypothetical protein
MRIAFALIALFLAPVLAFADASKHDLLIGRWRYADQNQSCVLQFRKNGTFAGEAKLKNEVRWKFAGRWSLAGNLLNYTYTESSLDRVPAGSIDQDKLIEITKEYFVVKAFDGSQRKYTRIGSGG